MVRMLTIRTDLYCVERSVISYYMIRAEEEDFLTALAYYTHYTCNYTERFFLGGRAGNPE